MEYSKTLISRASELAAKGCTDQDIAREFGVCRQTFANWKKAHPELKQAMDEGTRIANHAVESALYRRAIGYDTVEETSVARYNPETEKTEMVVIKSITKQVHSDVRAAELWLNNKDPENWRNRKEVNLKGKIESVVRRGPPVLNFSDTSPVKEPTLEDYEKGEDDDD